MTIVFWTRFADAKHLRSICEISIIINAKPLCKYSDQDQGSYRTGSKNQGTIGRHDHVYVPIEEEKGLFTLYCTNS